MHSRRLVVLVLVVLVALWTAHRPKPEDWLSDDTVRDTLRPPALAPAAVALLYGRKLDINRAGSEDLRVLPGIGPSRARAIVLARASRGGRFESAEDLLEVHGIGEVTFARVLPMVTVD